MTVRFTDEAWRNFQSIRQVIARDRPQAAKKMAERLLRACVGLEHFPQRGRRGRRSDTGELTTVWPFVIVYEIKADGEIQIDAIWHGAQNRR